MNKFNEFYNKIISEAASYKDPDLQYEIYRDSDQYIDDRKRRDQQLNQAKKDRRQKMTKYQRSTDLCDIIAKLIFDYVTAQLIGHGRAPNSIRLSNDYGLSLSYMFTRFPTESNNHLTVSLEKYIGQLDQEVVKRWRCTAGTRTGDIITHNFHSEKLFNPDYKETTQDDKRENLQQCKQFVKPICQFIKNNVKNLGQF